MLQGAVKEHERKAALQPPPRPGPASQPTKQSSLSSITQYANAGPKKPLNPVSASALNATRQPLSSYSGGVKRASNGLAKVVDGSFEDQLGSQNRPITFNDPSPPISTILEANNFNEDDFDSDIDLDIEEPMPKSAVSYPKLPTSASNGPSSKSVNYPTLPVQPAQPPSARQMSTPTFKRDAPQTSPAKHGPNSSAPFTWSSSPADHLDAAAPPSLQQYAYNAPSLARSTAQRNASAAQPKPAKRRTLPWQQTEEPAQVPRAVPGTNTAISTPSMKESKRTQHLWNTTASAFKEQSKKHREEARKAAQKADGTEHATIAASKSKEKRPAKVFLSDEQRHVCDLVVEKKKSVFFTGSAGTGKSVLMREIISSLRRKHAREPDRVAVTASTGLAACNVGGVTLHSFAGIGLGKEEVPELVRKIKRNQKAKHRWMRTKVLVIDEISMVDGELFDKLEAVARQIRNNARPFGGIQLVITGDFFQLPPVPENSRVARFAFDAGTWKTSIEHTIALHHVFRQKDPIFAGMLNEMREGRLTESSIKAFRSLQRPLDFEDPFVATELFPTRAEVDKANSSRLDMLQGDFLHFQARDGGSIVDKTQRDKLLSNVMAPESIALKKGAQVMLIKNVDESLVNGSIGRVLGFLQEREFDDYHMSEGNYPQSPGGTLQNKVDARMGADDIRARMTDSITISTRWPLVRFLLADGTWRDLLVQPESWKVELPNGEVQASRQQIPLILAWALSIHKAQGQTLDRVKVDLGKVFEKGQAYVALSRATSMAGLQVVRFDPKKVIAHDRVRAFYTNLSRVELAEQNKERMASVKKHKETPTDDYESLFVAGDLDQDF